MDHRHEPDVTFDFIGTLRVEGTRSGWLEVCLPEALVRRAAARKVGRPMNEIDDLDAFDAAAGMMNDLRESLLHGPNPGVGEATVAMRSGVCTEGRVQVHFVAQHGSGPLHFPDGPEWLVG